MFARPRPQKDSFQRVAVCSRFLVLVAFPSLLTLLCSSVAAVESAAVSKPVTGEGQLRPIQSLDEFLRLLNLDYRPAEPEEDPVQEDPVQEDAPQTPARGRMSEGFYKVAASSLSVAPGRSPVRASHQSQAPRVSSGNRAASSTYWSHNGAVSVLERPDESYQFPDRKKMDLGRDFLDSLENMEIDYEHRPEYLPPHSIQEAEMSLTNLALSRLAQKEFFRLTRRYLKKLWREQYHEAIGMDYDFYQARRAQIHQIGKDPSEFDPFNTDYYLNEARSKTFDEDGYEGEPEIALVEYGPFIIKDQGSVQFNLRYLGWDDFFRFHVDPESNANSNSEEALFSGEKIQVKPKMKLKLDPFRAFSGSMEDALRSYGGGLEMQFYSDILNRRLFATELEASSRGGDFAFFLNIVFHGRN